MTDLAKLKELAEALDGVRTDLEGEKLLLEAADLELAELRRRVRCIDAAAEALEHRDTAAAYEILRRARSSLNKTGGKTDG